MAGFFSLISIRPLLDDLLVLDHCWMTFLSRHFPDLLEIILNRCRCLTAGTHLHSNCKIPGQISSSQ